MDILLFFLVFILTVVGLVCAYLAFDTCLELRAINKMEEHANVFNHKEW